VSCGPNGGHGRTNPLPFFFFTSNVSLSCTTPFHPLSNFQKRRKTSLVACRGASQPTLFHRGRTAAVTMHPHLTSFDVAQQSKVKYTSICIAHFYAKRLKCAQTWITQFYLQITPCLPLFPSRRTSPPFGWYSFYRPTEGRRLSRPGWLVTYRNKVPPPGVEPGHGHPSQY